MNYLRITRFLELYFRLPLFVRSTRELAAQRKPQVLAILAMLGAIILTFSALMLDTKPASAACSANESLFCPPNRNCRLLQNCLRLDNINRYSARGMHFLHS